MISNLMKDIFDKESLIKAITELYAFIINNEHRLVEDVRNAMADEALQNHSQDKQSSELCICTETYSRLAKGQHRFLAVHESKCTYPLCNPPNILISLQIQSFWLITKPKGEATSLCSLSLVQRSPAIL